MGWVSTVARLWNEWELRVLVLLSLLLQVLLVSTAQLRKRSPRQELKLLIWILYLGADWVARYGVGVLSRLPAEQENDLNVQLLSFWSPFLLLHLGGPDTISALSLEDNQLWPRQALNVVVQAAITFTVLFRYYDAGSIFVPSLLVFIAGTLKYGERTWALEHGTMDSIRRSQLNKPEERRDYCRSLDPYAARLRSGVPAVMIAPSNRPRPATPAAKAIPEDPAGKIRIAYELFGTFQGAFVDAIFSDKDKEQSETLFKNATVDSTFQVIDTELSFAYDVLYTKAAVSRTRRGLIIRGVSFALTCFALLLFVAGVDTRGFGRSHLAITYTLLVGAMAIDAVSLLRLVFSDWTFVVVRGRHWPWEWIERWLLKLYRVEGPRWSNSMSQYNLIRFCLRGHFGLKDRRRSCCKKMLAKIGLDEKMLRKIGLGERWNNYCLKDHRPSCWKKMIRMIGWNNYWVTYHVKVSHDLRSLLVQELKHNQSRFWETMNRGPVSRSLSRDIAVGLQNEMLHGTWSLDFQQELDKFLLWSLDDKMELDEIILIWHIATDLCYITSEAIDPAVLPKEARIAREISNYLVYIMMMRPVMLSSSEIMGTKRFGDTCTELAEFLQDAALDIDEPKVCEMLRMVYTDFHPTDLKGGRSTSVLWDGCLLAKNLRLLKPETSLSIMRRVWVELLCYTAIRCKGYYHADGLREGGELLTFVWILMIHLGMGEQYKIWEGDVVSEWKLAEKVNFI